MHRIVFSGALTFALALSGCGVLIDSDITEFNLSLPDQDFTIDTAQWNLTPDPNLPEPNTFPAIPCDPANDICDQLASSVCTGAGCQAVCDPAALTCAVTVSVALSQSINLVDEKPELQTIENQPFLDVTIDEVTYEVLENTLNFDSPEVDIYVAPQNIMSPDTGEARLVGTMGAVPAMRQQPETPMTMTNDGENNLRGMMGDYRSVFNVIAGADAVIGAGDEIPTGRAVVRIRVAAHAGL